jgi:glycine/D-amino acid oxidase-like deaminating enzyme
VTRLEVDVAVIGNGSIGCALALRLSAKHPSVKVGLIAPSRRPDCASLAAGAMLGAFGEVQAGVLDSPFGRRKFEAGVQASKMWRRHLDLLNSRLASVAPVRLDEGTHVVSSPAASQGDDENFEAIVRALRELDEPFREVDPDSIAGTAPKNRSAGRRAIYIDEEGTVSAKHLHRAYDEALTRTPAVTTIDAYAASIEPDGAKQLVRTTTGETVEARHVVIAAGVHTQRFVERLGLAKRIPRIVFGIGVALVVKVVAGAAPTKVFRSPNRSLAGGLYVVPYGDEYCYLGATSRISAHATPLPHPGASRELLTRATDEVNESFARAEIHKTLVGYRPTTMDTFPLFGRTSIDGIWIASGTRRDGLHLSPKVADELIAAIDTGVQPFAGAFVPERPLILEREIPPEILSLSEIGDGAL